MGLLIPWYLAALVVIGGSDARQPARHVVSPPILGAWRFVGTAPPGFVRHGAEVARLTLSLRHGQLRALISTGKYHYTADGRYVAVQRQFVLTVKTVRGIVLLQATLGQGRAGAARMLGIWNDTHGDDGGFVLLRLPA